MKLIFTVLAILLICLTIQSMSMTVQVKGGGGKGKSNVQAKSFQTLRQPLSAKQLEEDRAYYDEQRLVKAFEKELKAHEKEEIEKSQRIRNDALKGKSTVVDNKYKKNVWGINRFLSGRGELSKIDFNNKKFAENAILPIANTVIEQSTQPHSESRPNETDLNSEKLEQDRLKNEEDQGVDALFQQMVEERNAKLQNAREAAVNGEFVPVDEPKKKFGFFGPRTRFSKTDQINKKFAADHGKWV